MRREGDPQRREKEGGRAEEEEERFIQNSRSEQLELRGGLRARPRHPGVEDLLRRATFLRQTHPYLSAQDPAGGRWEGGEKSEKRRGEERGREDREREEREERVRRQKGENQETRKGFKERGGTVREAEK